MYEVSLTESYFPAQTDDEVYDHTVGGLLIEAAKRTPDAPALQGADMDGTLGRVWTYKELLEDSERQARALLTRYKPGERITVWAPNIPEWVILEYGAALAGLTLVTANPAYQPAELQYVVEQSESVGLFLINEYRGNPMGRIAEEVKQKVSAIRELVDMEDSSAFYAGEDTHTEFPEVKTDDPAQIQYTSGTTGFPKGALLHHRGIANNARMAYKRLGSREGDVILNYMPMFHTAGCAILTLGSVQFSSKMIIAKLFSPPHMLEIIESEKVDMMLGVPTMLIGLIEAQAASPRDTSSVRIACSGGSMVPPELVRQVKRVFGCDFETVYGQTEVSPILTQTRADDSIEDLCDTVGQALPQTEISIRSPEFNRIVKIDEVGEICSRGYGSMLGYNNNPKATKETIDSEGWLHTGDLGTMDSRGFVKVTGRVKEMIIRGGENLFPAEIENVLQEHASVAEVAVVGVPDPKWGEIVACFVRIAAGHSLDSDALIAHCRKSLSPQKTPAHWVEVSEWPLTGSGKIRKFMLRQKFIEGFYTHE